MLHAAVLRSPYAHARVARIDLAPALALPGVHAAIGPDDTRAARRTSAATRARRSPRSAPTRSRRRAPRSRRSTSSGRLLEPLLDPDEAVARGELLGEPRVRARGDFERASREADVVVEGEYRTQVVLHNSMETHQSVVQWVGDTLEVYISTQYIWGVRDEVADGARPAGRQGARDLPVHGRRLRLEEQPGRLHVHRDRARAAHGPARPLRADAARGERRRRQPQRDDPAADDRRAQPTAR